MKIQIPPSRIILQNDNKEEACNYLKVHTLSKSAQKINNKLKNNATIEMNGGGVNKIGAGKYHIPKHSKADLEIFISEQHKNFVCENNNIIYKAHKPQLAAIKAYYGMLRSCDRENKILSKFSDEEYKLAIQNVSSSHKNDENIRNHIVKINNAMKEPGMLIELRKQGSNKVYKYFVEYQLIQSPNKHEMEKGIVKRAVANRK